MLLYSKHMAQLRQLLSNRNRCIQLLYQNIAAPTLCYPSLHLTYQENHGKQNVSNNGELLP